MSDGKTQRVAVLGASGYAGCELVRLLAGHSAVRLCVLTAERHAGQAIGEVFPHLGRLSLPVMVSLETVNWYSLDFVFCALPHGMTQEVVATLPGHLKVIDLSADLRFADVETYAQWYGQRHKAPELQKEVVYGLSELARPSIRTARVVACPGCYPTSVQLPLVPLLAAGLIAAEGIVIDAKSGVSGAGRVVKEESLFCEVTDGLHAYSIAHHRHAPEIEQGLSLAAGRPITVTFTPHLVPMSRGILSTLYVRLTGKTTAADLRNTLAKYYAGEAFVRVVPEGIVPHTHHVRGSNFCLIGVFADRVPGQAILCTVLDNLLKGAAGQAVQNFNLMTDQPEILGLEQQPLFP
ncbi:N-acetyl-gamma-glutamyl-phosphate reductase [invertebrate metagenome]|uniref:N-acetyl-gamma-glutamyl-phosphate reductase n=1 Tax=invertebrate metagenome TaxID=1711999 RepID=A0A484H6A2_9ZZZZ